jgi:hypothetical protein
MTRKLIRDYTYHMDSLEDILSISCDAESDFREAMNDGHEDALLSIRDLDAEKLEKLIATVKRVLKEGTEPWALTSAGKAELEEIKATKTREKPAEKSEATLFMADLEQGLDENAE